VSEFAFELEQHDTPASPASHIVITTLNRSGRVSSGDRIRPVADGSAEVLVREERRIDTTHAALLARYYPQVRSWSHSEARCWRRSTNEARQDARGEVIFLRLE